ncbi:DUF2964 family protein [Paraburkholderia ferrariae]|uniref:DUF2964 family protein n=1 Tax=Paraburkholderia ferrariae TaxID=386056 RepID=UPI0004851052|nr:DUF2964 family protein [Paraburkholderia ferrariae]
MIRAQWRIVCATVAVFAALAGLFLALDGLAFDTWVRFRYGTAALLAGAACFVMLLNPTPRDHED